MLMHVRHLKNYIMKQINNQEELDHILNDKKPVIIDFYADWCPPCKSLLPIVESLAEEYKDDIEIVKINVDSNQAIAQQFGVMNIPALFFIKDRKVTEHMVGLQTKTKLENKINQYINAVA